ncbi:MAG: hypothetical protein JNL74_15995 [Fibrobacteres bacterium]|nr:hypothetical protein [Fibrobacterota bacterium]
MKTALLLLIAVMSIFSQTPQNNDTYTSATQNNQAKPAEGCKVLVAMKYSYFEKLVLQNLRDSLKQGGCTITDIDISGYDKVDKTKFNAILLFSALKSGAPISEVRGTLGEYKKGSNLLVCRVYGDIWEKGSKQKKGVDAVSAATANLQPNLVAGKILANLKPILGM